MRLRPPWAAFVTAVLLVCASPELLAAEGGQDTDANGLPDIDEVREYNTDPQLSDRDSPNPESRPAALDPTAPKTLTGYGNLRRQSPPCGA